MKQILDDLLGDRRLLIPALLTAITIAVGATLIVFLTDDGPSDSAAAPAAPTGQPPTASARVDISDFKFKAPAVTIKAGGTVTWTNSDSASHTATASGKFDTGTLTTGKSKTVTLKTPGTYMYVCNFHPYMKGTVVVK